MPSSAVAQQALRALEALNPGKPDDNEALKAAWTCACERAGIAEWRVHDLRHIGATCLALSSGSVFLVKALIGHKALAMLERYISFAY